MKYLAFLFITVLILALGACGSGGPITLADLEGIGFEGVKKDTIPIKTSGEDINFGGYAFNQENKVWVGVITINGVPEFLEVVIFSSVPDELTKEQWKGIAEIVLGMRSSIINNIAIACQTQETCDYVKDKLS